MRFYCLSSIAILATPVCLAANTTDDDSSSSSTASTPTTDSHSTHTHHHQIPYTPYFPHSFQFPSTSAPSISPTSHPDSPIVVPPSVQAHQSPTIYILIIIAGIVGLGLIALCTRQAIAYTRSPRHTVAMTTVDRQQLVQEMAGYAQMANRRQRGSCLVSPPPPYERAPSYESLTRHESL
ncbi:hypothetical protein BC827DRAFT_1179844 [Russula dissimulans]|nr:hypothetical protein BC827DRAFT_1179844 [Russula dissimulans]